MGVYMFKSIDLFAGIGGIRKGFDNAFGDEIETVFVSEWDKFAHKAALPTTTETRLKK